MARKRYGTSENTQDNEARLIALETEIARKAAANGANTTTLLRENPTVTSQVTGLTRDTRVVGGITITWNSVPDTGLARYEVHVSEDSYFPGIGTEVFFVVGGSTTFLYQQGDPTKTYFFKVRAVTEKGTGLFSATLNSGTGQADTPNLTIGAATGVVKGTQIFNSGAGTAITAGNSLEFGHISMTTKGGPVLILATVQVTAIITAAGGASTTLQVFEDNIEIENFTYSITPVTSDLTVQGGFPGVTIPSTPNAGAHTYKFKLTVGGASGTVTLIKLRRTLIEQRAA